MLRAILGAFLATCANAELTVTDETDPTPPEEEYDVKWLKIGDTDEENFSVHGIITNNFDGNLTRELMEDNQHPSMVYVCDSKKILERDSQA